MFRIDVPDKIYLIIKGFLYLGMWNTDEGTSVLGNSIKLFYFLYYLAFTISMGLGCCLTGDKDERVFLAVSFFSAVVLQYKLWYLLWENRTISILLNDIGVHYTKDEEALMRVNNKLSILMKFSQYFIFMIFCAFVLLAIVFPVASQKRRLFINLAFPLDRSTGTGFWIANTFLGGGMFCASVCAQFTVVLWYLMYSFVIDYELLGNELKNMGASNYKLPLAKQQKLYYDDLITAVLAYDKINGKLAKFQSIFSKLFFLQMATSSICICGSVYTLAFSARDNVVTDGINCIILAYNFFDMFVVMYLGNEIKLSSYRLSYWIFESNWIEQTKTCKKCILILTERLKMVQELIVGKIYTLNLPTFTSIVKSAYSLFNILQNLRQ